MKRFVFEFHFYNESTDQTDLIHYGFEFLDVPPDRQEWFDGCLEGTTEAYEEFFWEMETYGIHDFGCGGDYEYLGYYSGEIAKDKVDEVMDRWRTFFELFGITCGPVVLLPETYTSEQERI